jgi:glycosyltransferase involved in cell wall biosynthesis
VHVLIVNNCKIPVWGYGGTQRIVWWLGKGLVNRGHRVTYLVKKGSACPFAKTLSLNSEIALSPQIPLDVDIIHLHFQINEPLKKPYIITLHGNERAFRKLDKNTVFVSQNHANRYQSDIFVYNGIDCNDYGQVNLNQKRKHLLFLARTIRKVKNLKQCQEIARRSGEKLIIAGGYGLSFNPKIIYKGIIDGKIKNRVLNESKALLYPVRGYEPFGLAIIESLYFGSPVIGTKHGSLPELVNPQVGFLSNSISELVKAVETIEEYNRRFCHEYAMDNFSSFRMIDSYLKLYEKVLNGHELNKSQPMRRHLSEPALLPVNS